MRSGVTYLCIKSDVHQRIVSFGVEIHRLWESDIPVVVSTRIDLLSDYVQACQGRIKAVWMLLDSSELAFSSREIERFVLAIRAVETVIFEVYAVGDLGGLLASYGKKFHLKLLYDKEKTSRLIEDLNKGSTKYAAFSLNPKWLYLGKDFIRHPFLCFSICFQRNNIILYLGSTGFPFARKALESLGMVRHAEQLELMARPFFASRQLSPSCNAWEAWKHLCNYCHEILAKADGISVDKDSRVFYFILSRSLSRMLQLSALSMEPGFKMILYPLKFANIYHWPSCLSPLFLDLGGINGIESCYPRYVDLMLRGQRILGRSASTNYNHLSHDKEQFMAEIKELICAVSNSLSREISYLVCENGH
jgi:hypothetical protein